MKTTLQHRVSYPSKPNYAGWPLGQLVDYIENKHHRYVKEQIPVLKESINQICICHGDAFPVLAQIRTLFHKDSTDLLQHLDIEEQLLFPVIRNIAAPPELHDENSCIPPSLLDHMINRMMDDHVNEGERWRKINILASQVELNNSTLADTFDLLREFENELHEHIYLENSLLFPSAVKMKQEQMHALSGR